MAKNDTTLGQIDIWPVGFTCPELRCIPHLTPVAASSDQEWYYVGSGSPELRCTLPPPTLPIPSRAI